MEEQIFLEKYNKFDPIIMLNSKRNPLQTIHSYLFENESHNIIHASNEVNKKINYINVLINNYENMDNKLFLKELLSAIAQIYYYQPFYDGNGRTLVIYLKYVFYQISIKDNKVVSIHHNNLRSLLRIFYHENEMISDNVINSGIKVLEMIKK